MRNELIKMIELDNCKLRMYEEEMNVLFKSVQASVSSMFSPYELVSCETSSTIAKIEELHKLCADLYASIKRTENLLALLDSENN